MHPSNFGKRNGMAQKRLLAAGQALTEKLGLDPRLMEGLKVQGNDAAIRGLKEREALADLLEAAVGKLPDPAQPDPALPTPAESTRLPLPKGRGKEGKQMVIPPGFADDEHQAVVEG